MNDLFAFGDPFGATCNSSSSTTMNHKKRARDEDNQQQGMEERNIHRTITHDEEDDDDFLSSILADDVCLMQQNLPAPSPLQPITKPIHHQQQVHWQQPEQTYSTDMVASTTTSLQQHPPPPVLTNSFVIQQQPMQQQRPPPAPTMIVVQQPTKPGPTQFVERWMCDICKCKKFDTFQEAEAHEIECQLAQEAKKIADQQQLQHDLTDLALCQPTIDVASQAIPGERRCAINLVPQGDAANVLSDHNNLLVRHVEFFYPSSDNRVGLRCIHCKYAAKQTASTFFPSSINSISSGFGTIGTRHFGWGKCPIVHASIVAELKVTKKTSNIQTKTNGRVHVGLAFPALCVNTV